MKKSIFVGRGLLILFSIISLGILGNEPIALAFDKPNTEIEGKSSNKKALSKWSKKYSETGIKKQHQENEKKAQKRRVVKQERFKNTKWLWHDDYSFYNHGKKRKNLSVNHPNFIARGRFALSITDVLLSSAFSDHLWLENFVGTTSNFLYRSFQHGKTPEDLPRHNVINKWRKPIKITLKTLKNDKQVDTKKYAYLIEHIKDFSKQYSEASGLEITYEHSVYPDIGDANVFIILDADSKIFNAFKNQGNNKFINDHGYEQAIFGAVRLTPDSRTQVEGFFIPNKDNEIQKASCYLKPEYLNEEYIKKLAAECMLRVLGFPETTELVRESLLYEWNKKMEPVSARPTSDPKLRFDEDNKEQWKESLSKKIDGVDSIKFSPLDLSPSKIRPMDLDLKFLSVLYCDDIKPGMDKYQFMSILISSERCFQ